MQLSLVAKAAVLVIFVALTAHAQSTNCTGVVPQYDQWCDDNCNHAGTRFCPSTLCNCSAGQEIVVRPCRSIASNVDDSFCNLVCNYDPPFCPAGMCRCETGEAVPAFLNITAANPTCCENDVRFLFFGESGVIYRQPLGGNPQVCYNIPGIAPRGIEVDSESNLYVADPIGGVLYRMSANCDPSSVEILTSWHIQNIIPNPTAIAILPGVGLLVSGPVGVYVVNFRENGTVYEINRVPNIVHEVVDIEVAPDGRVFIVHRNAEVVILDIETGDTTTYLAINQLDIPDYGGIAINDCGLYFSATDSNQIFFCPDLFDSTTCTRYCVKDPTVDNFSCVEINNPKEIETGCCCDIYVSSAGYESLIAYTNNGTIGSGPFVGEVFASSLTDGNSIAFWIPPGSDENCDVVCSPPPFTESPSPSPSISLLNTESASPSVSRTSAVTPSPSSTAAPTPSASASPSSAPSSSVSPSSSPSISPALGPQLAFCVYSDNASGAPLATDGSEVSVIIQSDKPITTPTVTCNGVGLVTSRSGVVADSTGIAFNGVSGVDVSSVLDTLTGPSGANQYNNGVSVSACVGVNAGQSGFIFANSQSSSTDQRCIALAVDSPTQISASFSNFVFTAIVTALDDGSRHMIAVAIDEENLAINFFVDEAQVSTQALSAAQVAAATTCGGNGRVALIGARTPTFTDVFTGTVSNVIVHDFALATNDLRFYDCDSSVTTLNTLFTATFDVSTVSPASDGELICTITDALDENNSPPISIVQNPSSTCSVSVDRVVPTAAICVHSNNADPTLAVLGDEVTVAFDSDEPVTAPVITCNGVDLTVLASDVLVDSTPVAVAGSGVDVTDTFIDAVATNGEYGGALVDEFSGVSVSACVNINGGTTGTVFGNSLSDASDERCLVFDYDLGTNTLSVAFGEDDGGARIVASATDATVFADGSDHTVAVALDAQADRITFFVDETQFGSVVNLAVGQVAQARTCGSSGIALVGARAPGSNTNPLTGSVRNAIVHNYPVDVLDIAAYQCSTTTIQGRTQYTGKFVVAAGSPIDTDGELVCSARSYADDAGNVADANQTTQNQAAECRVFFPTPTPSPSASPSSTPSSSSSPSSTASSSPSSSPTPSPTASPSVSPVATLDSRLVFGVNLQASGGSTLSSVLTGQWTFDLIVCPEGVAASDGACFPSVDRTFNIPLTFLDIVSQDGTQSEQGIPLIQPGSQSPSNSASFSPACAWHSVPLIRVGTTVQICDATCISTRQGAVTPATCTGQNLIPANAQARTRAAMTAVAQTLKPGFVVDTTVLPASSFQSASQNMCEGDVLREFSISQFHLPVGVNMDVTIFAQPRFASQRCSSPAVAPKVCYDTTRGAALHGVLGDANGRLCADEFILDSTVNTGGYQTVDASLPAIEGDLIDIDFGVLPNSRGCPTAIANDAQVSAMCNAPSNRLCLQPECP